MVYSLFICILISLYELKISISRRSREVGFTRCGCGVTALAVTPPGEFGDLPVFGKASNRDSRPWLESVRIAGEIIPLCSGDGTFSNSAQKYQKILVVLYF